MVDPTHVLGIGLGLGAAAVGAVHHVLIRKGTDRGRAADGLILVMAVNVAILLPLVAVYYYPDYGLTARSWVAFVAAGVFGTLLGRLFMYTSIDRIGASRTSPIVASNALVATVAGVLLLGETLTPIHAVGVVMIVGGVAAIAWETSRENPDDLSRRELLVGLVIPVAAAVAFGLEPIAATYGFAEGTPAPVGLVVKTVSATLGFLGYLRLRGAVPALSVVRTPDAKWFVIAGVANTLFLLGFYVGLAIAPVNVVVPIVTTSTLFVVVFSAAFMPKRLERVTWKLVAGALVVVAGVLIITVYG